MMSNLAAIIPGAQHWPHFIRNRSEQFEARFVMVEIQTTASIFFAGMGGARLPIVVSHGEGYAEFSSEEHARAARHLATVKYVDHHGAATLRYPFNPNGSPGGMTGFTTADGRFSIMMPHPERVFRTVQNSWHPEQWQEDSPWMRIFHNARKWVD
jgi:phosphoribosylformylglycinamidine synthase